MTDATWLSNPLSGDYNDGNNWVGGSVPGASGTAFFNASTNVALSFSAASTEVGGWTFDPGLVGYSFAIANGQTVHLNDAGIVLTSGHVSIAVDGVLDFHKNSPTAATAVITVKGSGAVYFQDASTAGDAVIDNNGILSFFNDATAGKAQITNEAALVATMYFNGHSSAGSASITNHSYIQFSNDSTASAAAIVSDGGLGFLGKSTAGNASISTANGGFVSFSDTSTGGNAQFITDAGGLVNFGQSGGAAGDGRITAGSIAGLGDYYLGGDELTVGGNDLSTEVGGAILEGPAGFGASLVKVGTGTLTLSGVGNTYSGGTTFKAGTVSVAADASLGSVAGGLTFDGGTLRVTGTSFGGTARDITWGAGGGGFDIASVAGSFILSQELTSGGGLTKLGAGTLVLAGADGFTGATTIKAGTLALSGAGAIVSSSGVVDDGVFDISLATGGASIKTLSGSGVVELGNHELTLTAASGNFAGAINGFGGLTLAAGSERLSHAGSYSGGTKLLSGKLDLAALNAAGSGAVTFAAGAQTLKLENAALAAHHFGNDIAAFGTGDEIDLAGLVFKAGASATYNAASHVLSVKSGAVTDTLTLTSPSGTHFAALGDHAGGTRIDLAIVGSAGNDTINAKHHPAGQPTPGAGANIILGLAGNDVLNGLGGGDTLVGGLGKDTLFGGTGGDSFVFQRLGDSTVAQRDVIMDFNHAQHDKIDLYDIDANASKAGNQAFVFIGGDTFAHYHASHHSVVGMVRFAGGVLQANVNANLAADFAIAVHGQPTLHAGDFVL